jgi:hypothetical protein
LKFFPRIYSAMMYTVLFLEITQKLRECECFPVLSLRSFIREFLIPRLCYHAIMLIPVLDKCYWGFSRRIYGISALVR